MKTFKLTKEEFIRRSMDGDKFEFNGSLYHYDQTKSVPFKIDNITLGYGWDTFNGINEFTLVEPKPKTEKQWLWRNLDNSGTWVVSQGFYSEKIAWGSWIKLDYTEIEVEV